MTICKLFHGCQCDSWEHNDTKCCHHVPVSLSRLLRNADSEDEVLEPNDYHVIKVNASAIVNVPVTEKQKWKLRLVYAPPTAEA